MTHKAKQITIFQNQSYKELGILYGLFFEDINHAADGGLYAEMVQNGSFEYCEIDRKDYHALTAWEKTDKVAWEIRTGQPAYIEKPHYLCIEAQPGGGVCNIGYNSGFFVEEGKGYDFSMLAGGVEGDMPVRIMVKSEEGCVCAESTLTVSGKEWKKYELQIKASKTTICGRLFLLFEEGGSCSLDMVSFFPQYTFLGKKGGLRKDIAQALREMHPKFMRFPGGCLVHDGSLNAYDRNSMYRWKRTIGKLEERPSWRNNWGYNQSLGIGYFEYFCFCEEIGAEPVPILPGGFNPHKGVGAAIEDIGEWVDDALDLIEFANGGSSLAWGKIRKDLGHEAPFNLKYIGIGNEEVGDGFFERYPYFHKAIRDKYPDIKIINTAGPFAVGEGYDVGWRCARKYGSDLIDEHYYSSPEWFLANMHHYDDYDANGPKVFLGEYASWGNTYYNALVEAAYMTHLEKSPVVAMACYAPMLCNVDYVNWKPDMLWFNNHEILKTPNYYVQKLFMENQGTDAVAFETKNLDEVITLTDEKAVAGKFKIAGDDIEGKISDVKITDFDTGHTMEFDDILIDKDNSENLLMDIESGHYKASFRFRRTDGTKGLRIFFGEKDDKNRMLWEFGGWDNQGCNLTSFHAGRSSVISHRIFSVKDMEYVLELEVEGRKIKTRINGTPYNDAVCHLPELEELYVTASVDRNNDRTILKAVNLTGEEKEVKLLLDGSVKNSVEIICLSGHGLGEENTFENPDNIVPQIKNAAVKDNELLYTFTPHSVTIFSFA